jgi:uncharacterized membrane protein
MTWTHVAPSLLASFLASLVEFVEAMTIILAVGAVRGWRGALGGSGLALLVLLALVAVVGPALTQIPLVAVQLAVGALLLLFGIRWLRKAILRSAGVIPLHDETAAFAQESKALLQFGVRSSGWDGIAVTTAFKITMLEGIEVVFIVVAIGAVGPGLLLPASIGAVVALLVVVLLGLLLHQPVASIPENTLKFAVGILLSAFGTFWVAEGMSYSWPSGDWSVLELVAGYAAVALLIVAICRTRAVQRTEVARQIREQTETSWIGAVGRTLISLFVDDGQLASAMVLWLLIAWWVLPWLTSIAALQCVALFGGLAVILAKSSIGRASVVRAPQQ